MGHILGQNGVWRKFHSKGSKMSHWWSAAKYFLKTRIPQRLTVFCKLAIVLVVTGISEIFTVRPPNWRSDDKQENEAKNDYYEASDSFLQICHLLGKNRVQLEFHTNSRKMSLWR